MVEKSLTFNFFAKVRSIELIYKNINQNRKKLKKYTCKKRYAYSEMKRQNK